MPEAFVLSASDLQVLKELLEAHRRRVSTQGLRSPTELFGMDDPAPELHLAKLNPDQTEAMGVRTDDDPTYGQVAGSGTIDLYRIDSVNGEITKNPTNERDIWNPFNVKPSSDFVIVARTKFGSWIPLPSGGSGAPRIRFTILSTAFTVGEGALGCDHVIGLVNHVSCTGAGVSVGDEVKIYDPEYCHFNLPIELLVGLSGTATLMDSASYQEGLDYVVDCLAEIRADGCIWMIDTLCCSEEEYIGG